MLAAALFFSLVRVEGRALVASRIGARAHATPRRGHRVSRAVAGTARGGRPRRSTGLRSGLPQRPDRRRRVPGARRERERCRLHDRGRGEGGLLGALGAFTLGGRRLAVVFGGALVFWGLPIAYGALDLSRDGAAPPGRRRCGQQHRGCRGVHTSPADRSGSPAGAGHGRNLGLGGAVALGSIFAPAVVSLLGPEAALVIVGMILPVLVLLAWRRLVAVDRAAPRPTAQLALIDSVPMFEPLSWRRKNVSRRRSCRCPSRRVTLSFERTIRGRFLHRRGRRVRDPGGERGSPRMPAITSGRSRCSATSAHGDRPGGRGLDLYALRRNDFLAAVTGHADVRWAGIAAERLARGSGEPSPARSHSGQSA